SCRARSGAITHSPTILEAPPQPRGCDGEGNDACKESTCHQVQPYSQLGTQPHSHDGKRQARTQPGKGNDPRIDSPADTEAPVDAKGCQNQKPQKYRGDRKLNSAPGNRSRPGNQVQNQREHEYRGWCRLQQSQLALQILTLS